MASSYKELMADVVARYMAQMTDAQLRELHNAASAELDVRGPGAMETMASEWPDAMLRERVGTLVQFAQIRSAWMSDTREAARFDRACEAFLRIMAKLD